MRLRPTELPTTQPCGRARADVGESADGRSSETLGISIWVMRRVKAEWTVSLPIN